MKVGEKVMVIEDNRPAFVTIEEIHKISVKVEERKGYLIRKNDVWTREKILSYFANEIEDDTEDDELETIDIYDDFIEIHETTNEILEKLIKVGDLQSLVEIEHLLDEKKEYARQRDITEKINEIVKSSEAFNVIEEEEEDHDSDSSG